MKNKQPRTTFGRMLFCSLILTLLMSCGGAVSSGGNSSAAPATNNLVVTASRVSGVAPLAVFFDTNGTTSTATSLSFHEVKYSWNFGDATAAAQTWSYGAKAGTASKNLAYGPVAAHVFETPGNYTVTATSFDGTTTMTKTVTITVTDPDTVFATSNTVCVSSSTTPVAGSGGCPVGAAVVQTSTWSQMSSLTNTYKRVLLRRGDTWNTDNAASINAVGPGLITAYGSGSKPQVIAVANTPILNFYKSDWRLVDVEMVGNGTPGLNKNFMSVQPNAINTLLLRLHVSDVRVGLSSLRTTGLYVVDSLFENGYARSLGSGWYEPISYIELTDNVALLGSRFFDAGSHVVRLQGTASSVISNSEFVKADGGGNALTIRGKSSDTTINGSGYVAWDGTWSERVVVSDNITDNSLRGGYSLYIGPQSVNHAERVRDVIVERNVIKGGAIDYVATFSIGSNATVRNNIFYALHNYCIGLSLGGNVAGSPVTSGFYVYNNSIYKNSAGLTTNFSGFFVASIGAASNVKIENNLIYAPGNTKDGATNGSRASLVVFYGATGTPGVNYTLANNSTDTQINTVLPWATATPTVLTDFNPINGSYAYHLGSREPVWDDFFLNPTVINPTTTIRSIGAVRN